MPSTLRTGTRRRRNNLIHLDLCFSNFTHPFIHESPPRRPTSTSSSLHHDHHIINHNRPSASTTTTTTSTSVIKNFNTLYDHTTEPEPEPEPADFATAFASQRFFFSSPGRSNSIVESTPPSSFSSSSPSLSSSLTATAQQPPESSAAVSDDDDNNNNESKVVLFEGSVAVPTYSPDPYVDFRRSMQEMVEARPELMVDMKSNWHVLHELLLCYLALNPKTAHKFIFGAFADLLVTLMGLSSSCSCSCSSSPSLPPENPDPDEVAGGDGGC